MMVWIGVMLSLLVILIGGTLYALFSLRDILRLNIPDLIASLRESRSDLKAFSKSIESTMTEVDDLADERTERFEKALDRVLNEWLKAFDGHTERLLATYEQNGKAMIRSQDDLTASLSELGRDLKISKNMAQAGMLLAEKTVEAVNYFRSLAEAARSGPRSAAVSAPTEEQAAEWEKGATEQDRAILEMLTAAREAADSGVE